MASQPFIDYRNAIANNLVLGDGEGLLDLSDVPWPTFVHFPDQSFPIASREVKCQYFNCKKAKRHNRGLVYEAEVHLVDLRRITRKPITMPKETTRQTKRAAAGGKSVLVLLALEGLVSPRPPRPHARDASWAFPGLHWPRRSPQHARSGLLVSYQDLYADSGRLSSFREGRKSEAPAHGLPSLHEGPSLSFLTTISTLTLYLGHASQGQV
jgi:hypothetical protein